jgi:putative oxidoreductase
MRVPEKEHVMSESTQNTLVLIGRVLLSLIFVLSGFDKLTGWSDTGAYMASKGMPFVPFFLGAAIVLELGGGLSVALGYRARLGAFALAVFVVPTTLIFHDFWTLADPERQLQTIMFLKNLSMLGGLLLVAAYGPGRFSLDGYRSLRYR